jgi:hypothetical protein
MKIAPIRFAATASITAVLAGLLGACAGVDGKPHPGAVRSWWFRDL